MEDTIQVFSASNEGLKPVQAEASEESVEETEESTSSKGSDDHEQEQTEESEQNENEEESSESDSDDDDEESEEEDEDSKGSKHKKKSSSRRRRERYQRHLQEKDKEIEFLRRQLEGKNAPGDKRDAPQDISTENDSEKPVRPREEDFETHEAFVEAHDKYIEDLTDYKLEQKEKKRLAEENQRKARLTFEERKAAHNKRIQEFREKQTDYDDVLSDFMDEHGEDFTFSPGLTEAIIESENGPALIYELAKNPEELLRINALSPLAAARAIGMFEAKLTPIKESSSTGKNKTTRAPAPPKPVGAQSRASVAKKLSDPNLSQAEFEEAYERMFGGKR